MTCALATTAGASMCPSPFYGVQSKTCCMFYFPLLEFRILKCNPPLGKVSAFAGSGFARFADGVGTSTLFYNPYALDVDMAGNIYVADTSNNRIRKISSSGNICSSCDQQPFCGLSFS